MSNIANDKIIEENTSGHGKMAAVPPEVRGWSWGAFLLTWIWGVGNGTYRAFWCFFPIVNIFMGIALGLKGREWAWRNRRWESVEHFNQVQRKWGIAGLVFILVLFAFWGIVTLSTFIALNNAQPTKMAIALAQQNTQLQAQLGTPIKKSGFTRGNIEFENDRGDADLRFPISGPNGSGMLDTTACKVNGNWYLIKFNYTDTTDPHKNLADQLNDPAICG